MTKALPPPANTDAEMATLGSILLDPKALADVMDRIGVSDFYSTPHQLIYDACLEMWANERPIDLLTLQEALISRGDMSKVGGMEYLTRVMESVPSSANAEHYAGIVREHARRRQVIQAAQELARIAGNGWDQGHAAELYGRIALAIEGTEAAEAQSVSDILGGLEEIPEGIPTGIKELDNALGGLHRQDLILLASRPSVGKTSLALNILYRTCAEHRAMLHSLESSRQEIALSLLAMHTGHERQRYRCVRDEVWGDVSVGMGQLSGLRLVVDDRSGITAEQIRASVERASHRERLDLVVVDYLGLMGRAGKDRPVYELGEIARSMKQMARRFDIPVVLIVQLNRGNDRECRKPRLSDLRDSGELEQHADVVILLHDPVQFAQTDEEREKLENGWFDKRAGRHHAGHKGEVNIIIAKNRFGARPDFWIPFDARCLRFGSWETQQEF